MAHVSYQKYSLSLETIPPHIDSLERLQQLIEQFFPFDGYNPVATLISKAEDITSRKINKNKNKNTTINLSIIYHMYKIKHNYKSRSLDA